MLKKISIVFVFVPFLYIFLLFKVEKADAIFNCMTLNSNSSQTDKAYCQNELNQIEAQLADLLQKQAEQQKQTGTLKGDINYLTSQINALKAKIKARTLKISQLKVDIKDKSNQIETLSEKINRERESLAQLLRNTNDFDNRDFIYLIFSDQSISDFYGDLESYTSIKKAIKSSVDQIQGLKSKTEVQKNDLQKKQDAETDAKAELESAQKKVVQSETEKKQLLVISKQKESEYKKLADEKKARANKIRSALFALAGISEKIEFGTALRYANEAKSKTGIDPAFLLAILTQESNLGANVGKCYLTDISGPQAGYGISVSTNKTWTNLMKPDRDLPPFLEITGKLGIDPLKTFVSCPITSAGGYGGAMGPAQFIPSTWKLFEDRLATLLGYEANPWAPKDAFMASALYLADLGAVGTNTSTQNRAACKYYGSGGSSCSYGRSVQKLKSQIQSNIDLLQ